MFICPPRAIDTVKVQRKKGMFSLAIHAFSSPLPSLPPPSQRFFKIKAMHHAWYACILILPNLFWVQKNKFVSSIISYYIRFVMFSLISSIFVGSSTPPPLSLFLFFPLPFLCVFVVPAFSFSSFFVRFLTIFSPTLFFYLWTILFFLSFFLSCLIFCSWFFFLSERQTFLLQ